MTDPSFAEKFPSLAWVAPFAVFMLLLGVSPLLAIPEPWESIARVIIIAGSLLVFSKGVLRQIRVSHALSSTLLGIAVFALWVLPDQVVPGWRSHWLFQNDITGTVTNSIKPADLSNPLVVVLRFFRAAILVPVLEELFWRGWLPRWMAKRNWQELSMGYFTTASFVIVAVLFASEHGPFWEVGLVCGLIYNWWMWRTKSLGDLILTHAVTNAALSTFVMLTGQYGYWM